MALTPAVTTKALELALEAGDSKASCDSPECVNGKAPAPGGEIQGGKFLHRYMFSEESAQKENAFIARAAALVLVVLVCFLGIAAHDSTVVGKFDVSMLSNTAIVLVIEILWRILLSAIAWKYVGQYKRTINYTRKLGNLLRLPKFFLAEDLLPQYKRSPLALIFMLCVDQLIFIAMYAEVVRKQDNPISRFLRFLFLCQDRCEDRPNTLQFQVTEDILRFAVYIPFRLYFSGSQAAVIYIPIVINTIGDGLAEPVGIYCSSLFKKRGYDVTYKTKSLYTLEGGFWSGDYNRSYPGSMCVFVTSIVALCVNYSVFTKCQFWFMLFTLPLWMTLTEAYAPHTNDGPVLALVGCGLLAFVFQL